jgi:NitT/TauT family transport system permease protein
MAKATRSSNRLGNLAWSVFPFICLIAVWMLVHASGWISPALLPSPLEVLQTFWTHLTQGGLLVNMAMSIQRVVGGLLLGMLLAVPIGFLIGWYKPIRRFVDPLINFFRALPPIALIPLVIVYFGIGEMAKIAILFYASFFAAVIVMYEGMNQISPVYIRVAKTLGATDMEIFLKVMVPMTVPHMLTALRVALGVAWATLVAAELVAAQEGLGAMIQNASAFFDLRAIYVGIISIGAIALLMDVGIRKLSNRLISWQDRAGE